MSYLQRFVQSSSLRNAAASWRTGVTQLQAARAAVAASQRFSAAPLFAASAPSAPVAGFSSTPSISTSFAASGLLNGAGSSTTAAAVGESDESGNSLGGASHTGTLCDDGPRLRRRRKRF
ncbi:hypothetical protein HYH03_016860 [Edaphochlamys debaryana]|uniref:Uncharacterized protein n=1 Tax=Edaphochlamys debaryana TaxID=47281 RepID=A0A836BR60_9CHLO|nr:hypothetical protein HYH03_016860 [Edaphochlamys debaryana]|eukprot:KAG2484318.1 hypothetical protein HYH03_016860 [Edaphochlamys debaryana]